MLALGFFLCDARCSGLSRAQPQLKNEHGPEAIDREVLRIALFPHELIEGSWIEVITQRRIATERLLRKRDEL